MEEAFECKKLRYADLVAEAEERGLNVKMCPVKVGCSGFVAMSTIRGLRKVGVRGQAHKNADKALANAAERSSQNLAPPRLNGNQKYCSM